MHQTNEQTASQAKPDPDSDDLLLQGRMTDIRHKLLVLSGKGGVGKSTVAANLAVALARAGRRVGLVDVDVHGPSIPKMMGIEGRPIQTANEEVLPVQAADNLGVISLGLLLPSRHDAVIWRGPRKHGLIRQFLQDVAWGQLDYLVVDSPPGTGDEPLSVAQLVGDPAEAVVVTTPQDVAIADVRRCVEFCRTLSLKVLGIIENMSGLMCPKCGERIDVFKRGGGAALAHEMQVPFLGRIPIDPEVVTCGDAGLPLLRDGPRSPAAAAFTEVVNQILATGLEYDQSGAADEAGGQQRHLRIVVPLLAGQLSPRLGKSEELAVFEVDQQTGQIVRKSVHKAPLHLPGVLPRRLRELGADVVLASEMGQQAQQLLEQQGIQVVLGVAPNTPEQLVMDYLNQEEAGRGLAHQR